MKKLLLSVAALALTVGVGTLLGLNTKPKAAEVSATKSHDWYCLGEIGEETDWDEGTWPFSYDSVTDKHTLTIELHAGDQFKFANLYWTYEKNAGDLSAVSWVWFAGSGNNNVRVRYDGTYTFVIDDDTDALSVTATNVDYSGSSLYLVGDSCGDNWGIDNSWKFTYDSVSDRFTLNDKKLVGDEGSNEFGFKIGDDFYGAGVLDDLLNGIFTNIGNNFACRVTGYYSLVLNPNTGKATPSIVGSHYYVRVNGETQYPLTFEPTNGQFMIANLSLAKNDLVYLHIGDEDKGYAKLQHNEQGDCRDPFDKDTSGAIKIKNASSYEFYFKYWENLIWAQIDSHIEANNWAADFLDNIGCNGSSKPSGWDTYSVSFGTLTNGAKYLFVSAVADNGEGATGIQQAAFIHDMCVRKYSLDVFMAYNDGEDHSRLSASTLPPVTGMNTPNTIGSTALIIVVSIGVLSAAGYFFYRKKHQAE